MDLSIYQIKVNVIILLQCLCCFYPLLNTFCILVQVY